MKLRLQLLALTAASLPWWPMHAAEPMGRLFFTPAQRSALDAGKAIATPKSSRAPSVPPGPREVTLNGVVTRSDGESTVWVNGRALDGNALPGVSATASGSDPAAARVKLRGTRGTVQLRVGQRLERATGAIAEPYESVAGPTGAGTTPVAKQRKPATGRKRAPANPETLPDPPSDD